MRKEIFRRWNFSSRASDLFYHINFYDIFYVAELLNIEWRRVLRKGATRYLRQVVKNPCILTIRFQRCILSLNAAKSRNILARCERHYAFVANDILTLAGEFRETANRYAAHAKRRTFTIESA